MAFVNIDLVGSFFVRIMENRGTGDLDVYTKSGRRTLMTVQTWTPTFDNRSVSLRVRYDVRELQGDRTHLGKTITETFHVPEGHEGCVIHDAGSGKTNVNVSHEFLGQNHAKNDISSLTSGSYFEDAWARIDGPASDDRLAVHLEVRRCVIPVILECPGHAPAAPSGLTLMGG